MAVSFCHVNYSFCFSIFIFSIIKKSKPNPARQSLFYFDYNYIYYSLGVLHQQVVTDKRLQGKNTCKGRKSPAVRRFFLLIYAVTSLGQTCSDVCITGKNLQKECIL